MKIESFYLVFPLVYGIPKKKPTFRLSYIHVRIGQTF